MKRLFFITFFLLTVASQAQLVPDTLGIDDPTLLPTPSIRALLTLDECDWPGGNVSAYGLTHDAVARGDRLYIANHQNTTQTVVVIDISDPASISITGYDDVAGHIAQCLDVTDFSILVPDVNGYIHKFIIDPDLTGSPSTTYLTSQEWRDIKICGDIMFLLSAGRLYAYDITSGYTYLTYYTTTSRVNKALFVQGDYIFVAGGGSGFDIFRFNPDVPSFTKLCTVDDVVNNNIWDVWANGDLLYTADYNNSTIREYDIEDPTTPSYTRSIPSPGFGINPTGIMGDGDYIYMTGNYSSDGYIIGYDTQPASITEVGMDSWEGGSFRCILHGMWAYIVTRDQDVFSRQIADTVNSPCNSLELEYPASWIRVFGNVAYIADSLGCQIISIDNPCDPDLEDHFGFGEYYWSLDICDNYLYLWDFQVGLSVYDITDPLDPEFIIDLDKPDIIGEIVIHENYIYLSGYKISGIVDNEWKLYVFDITDREDPVLDNELFIDKLDYDWAFGLIEVVGNTAYLSLKDPPYWPTGTTPASESYDNIIKTIDISDPTAPSIDGDYHYSPHDTTYWAPIALDGYYLDYSMDYNWFGVGDYLVHMCWEATDISSNTWLGFDLSAYTDPMPLAAKLWGNLFWATVNNKLIRVDITDPTSPSPATIFTDGYSSMRLEHFDITDDYALVLKNYYGSPRSYYIHPIQIYDHMYCPESKQAKEIVAKLPENFDVCVSPNPFNSAVTFSVCSYGGDCVIEVSDILGRKVRTVCDEPLCRGTHNISWDGTDDTGQNLPSGVYYYMVNIGDSKRCGRLVLMK